MNINMKGSAFKPVSYGKGAKLKADSFYEDQDGGLVITDNDGKPVVVFCFGEAFAATQIAWPVQTTPITSVTVSL